MARMGKYLSLCLVVILAASSLLMVIPTNAQTIPKPSVPEFSVMLVSHPYDVAPTTTIDPYTGKTVVTQAGYYNENRSILISMQSTFHPNNRLKR